MTDETTATGVPETPAPVENTAPETPEVSAQGVEAESPPPADQPGISARDAFEHPEVQKRLKEQTWRLREAERRFDQMIEAFNQPKQPEPVAPLQEPTLEQHNYDETAYRKAMVEFVRAEARREAQQTLQQEREQAQRRERQESFKSREAKFAEAADDYYDVVYDPSTPISPAMAEVIAESEIGAELAYHLGKNPELARKIYPLPPILAARELGRLEVKLTQPKPPVVTKAPPPPPKIEATEPEVEKDPLRMSDAEFAKWRKRQIAQRR